MYQVVTYRDNHRPDRDERSSHFAVAIHTHQGEASPPVYCPAFRSGFCINPLVEEEGELHLSRWSIGPFLPREKAAELYKNGVVEYGDWSLVLLDEGSVFNAFHAGAAHKRYREWCRGEA
jgi:hypothetical protein